LVGRAHPPGINGFLNAILPLFFTTGLTLAPGQRFWLTHREPLKQRIRRDLVHAFLGVFSLQLFAVPALPFVVRFEGFPVLLFIESVAQVSAQFLAKGCSDQVIAELLANSFILIARQPQDQAMRDSLVLTNPAKLLKAFASSPPLFDATCPIADEALAFFYVSLCCHPNFASHVATSGEVNTFIASLAFSASRHVDENGYSPIVAIHFSSILHLLAFPDVALRLNSPVDGTSSHGSYADLLLGACAKACTEELQVIVGRVFHTLAPSLSSVTSSTAQALLAAFAWIIDAGGRALPLWAEAFALIVQRHSPYSPEFRSEIFAAQQLFARLKDSAKGPAVATVLRFITAAGSQENAATADDDTPLPAPEPFTESSAAEWTLCIDELFAQAFARELKELAGTA
jgi:hypothetical protein